ncbi:MAG TPA: SCO family protein [Acidobacteriota bacterium]|nr:SCO family protein [Acidobacteriota bacterium]
MKHFPTLGRTASVLLLMILAAAAGCSRADQFQGNLLEEPKEPQLTGTNWNGEPFQLSQLEGKVSVVFFGYTSCPDICPYTLVDMKKLKGQLGAEAKDVEVVFVSVDPHRDTVEKLANYVPRFDDSFYGIRLDNRQLEEARESFDLVVQYGQPKDGPGTDSFYYVDHTSSFFLIGKDGMLRVVLPPNAGIEMLKTDIRQLLNG